MKSVCWYDIFSCCILSIRVFVDISKEAWPKRRIWCNIKSLVFFKELSISFINCTQEGPSLISKQRAVKKKNVYLFQHQGYTNKMDSKYLENCVWIYAHASDLDQGVVLWGIPVQLWQLNTLFGDGLINFNKFFLEALRLAALGKLRTNLFHPITVDGKKEFLKTLCLVWRRVILSAPLAL